MREASLSLVTRDHTILLVLRSDVPIWVLPGGGIDAGESPESCAIRETFEETGIHTTIDRLAGIYHPHSWLSSKIHVFKATPQNFEFPKELSSEVRAVRFFPLHSLPKNLFFLHKTIIEECLENTTLVDRTLHEISWKNAVKMCIQHPLISLRYAYTRIKTSLN